MTNFILQNKETDEKQNKKDKYHYFGLLKKYGGQRNANETNRSQQSRSCS